jgi:hypothetical protein
MVTMGNDWAVATKGPNGKMKLIPVTDTFIPQLSNDTNHADIDANLTENGDNRRFRSKMRAEFTVNSNDMLNCNKMKLFVQAFKHYDNDIIISSIEDKHFKIRSPNDVPSTKTQFVELFPMEEYKRNKATCVHVFFTLESNTRIDMFKKDVKFMQFLEHNKIFLSEHKWESLRIYSVGMFTKMLYNVTYRMDFESKIQQVINEKMKEEHEKNELEKANITSTEMEELFEDDDDNASTKTEHAKNEAYDIPQIDIITKSAIHYHRDKYNRIQGSPLRSSVLELRCDKKHAEIIQNILKDANLPEKTFGKFSPYDITSNNPTLLYNLLVENNIFHNDAKVITLFGLHESVLKSTIQNPYNQTETVTASEILNDFYWKISETESFSVPILTERSRRSTDSGKWYFVTNEQGYPALRHLLEQLITAWVNTPEYINNKSVNESFKRGIRFNNRATNDQSLAAYEQHLVANTFNYENNSDTSSIASYNSIKRNKRVAIYQDRTLDQSHTPATSWKGWGSPDSQPTQPNTTTDTNSIDHTQASLSSTLSSLTATELSKQFNDQFHAYQTKIDASSIAQETFNDDMKSAILTQQSNFAKQQHSMDEMSHNFNILNSSVQEGFQKLFSDMKEIQTQFQMTLAYSPNNNRYDESISAQRLANMQESPPSPDVSDTTMPQETSISSPLRSPQLAQRLATRFLELVQPSSSASTAPMFTPGEGNGAFSQLG